MMPAARRCPCSMPASASRASLPTGAVSQDGSSPEEAVQMQAGGLAVEVHRVNAPVQDDNVHVCRAKLGGSCRGGRSLGAGWGDLEGLQLQRPLCRQLVRLQCTPIRRLGCTCHQARSGGLYVLVVARKHWKRVMGHAAWASHVRNLEPVPPPRQQRVPEQSCGGAEHGRVPVASCRGRPCPAAACGRGGSSATRPQGGHAWPPGAGPAGLPAPCTSPPLLAAPLD